MNFRQLTLLALTVVSGSLVSGLYGITRDQINNNREQFEQKQLYAVVNDDSLTLTKVDEMHYLLTDDNSAAGSVNLITTQAGYNGVITLWVATNEVGDIRGVRTAAHRETPGIGDIIEHEVSGWIDQFAGNVEPVDIVSGATITTRAVINAVNNHLADNFTEDSFVKEKPHE
jgi:electron transport complex protein RnfG